jgi:hypothetical protein
MTSVISRPLSGNGPLQYKEMPTIRYPTYLHLSLWENVSWIMRGLQERIPDIK